MNALRQRLDAVDVARLDPLLAIALAIGVGIEVVSLGVSPPSKAILSVVAGAMVVAPVAVRRRWPGRCLIFSVAALTAQQLLGGYLRETSGVGVELAVGLLAYGAGAWLDLRSAVVSLVVAGAVFSGFNFGPGPGVQGGLGSELFLLVVNLMLPWFIGRVGRERTRRAAAFRELATQAAERRSEGERAAVEGERVRISSELHDIIAHSVSAMVIQAGGARRLVRSDPERARESILNVERSGRQTLGDLRRLLGMLRRSDDPRALAPQPGLGQLDALAERLAGTGLACEHISEGTPVDLTPGIDLVGYRVAEAALAWASDSGSARAAIVVRYGPRWLEIEISADGPMPDVDEALGGIAKRVALYDGTLQALAVWDGQFAVLAQLPLASAVSA